MHFGKGCGPGGAISCGAGPGGVPVAGKAASSSSSVLLQHVNMLLLGPAAGDGTIRETDSGERKKGEEESLRDRHEEGRG